MQVKNYNNTEKLSKYFMVANMIILPESQETKEVITVTLVL